MASCQPRQVYVDNYGSYEMSLPVLEQKPEIHEDPLDLMDEIESLKKEKDATILAHYYQDGDIQELADFTGDSLKLARAATRVETDTIVFCGVHFMAETAKMLNPEKRVLLPDLKAGCSLAESCPAGPGCMVPGSSRELVVTSASGWSGKPAGRAGHSR